jgi:hypothetical protein
MLNLHLVMLTTFALAPLPSLRFRGIIPLFRRRRLDVRLALLSFQTIDFIPPPLIFLASLFDFGAEVFNNVQQATDQGSQLLIFSNLTAIIEFPFSTTKFTLKFANLFFFL